MDEGEIRRFIQTNLKYFGPDGLGWPRPGGLPKYYTQHPEEWSIDLAQVEELRRRDAARARAEQMARIKAAAVDQSGGGATASSGMSDDTRSLFRQVNKMSVAGRAVKEISAQLSMPERCVRNALAPSGTTRTVHTPRRRTTDPRSEGIWAPTTGGRA